MPIPIWAGRYIGLPFKDHGRDRAGLDCWGLVRLVLAEQFALALPSLAAHYPRTTDQPSISRLIERETLHWQNINDTQTVRAGDVIVLRLNGAPMHVGVVIGDGRMLHIERGINSVIESYRTSRWESRIYGFFRYTPHSRTAKNEDDA